MVTATATAVTTTTTVLEAAVLLPFALLVTCTPLLAMGRGRRSTCSQRRALMPKPWDRQRQVIVELLARVRRFGVALLVASVVFLALTCQSTLCRWGIWLLGSG
jgi:hypothetical protein